MQKNTESHIKLKRLLGILCYLLWTNPVLSMVINQEQLSDVSHGADVLSQTDNQLCNPGYVFQNNSCVSCTSKPAWIKYAKENRMFCGGVKVGEMNRQLKDQIQKCPAGAFPNSELTDCECGYGLESKDGKCVGSLSYDDMYYGPGGPSAPLYKQCWTKSHDEKAYKKCMGFDTADKFITGDSSNNLTKDSTSVSVSEKNNTNISGVSIHINLTQKIYNTDVIGYENIDLSKMTEKQACEYWKGHWENNTCENHYGPGKASRFDVFWFSKEKKFKCLNVPEQVEQGFADGTGANAEWVEYHKQDIKDRPWAFADALWDPIVLECTSKSERDCRDTAIGSWSSVNNKCYLPSENRSNCESVGAKYQDTSTTQRCDCILDDREFHWTYKDGCEYEYTRLTEINGKTYLGKGHTGGIMPNTQYSPVELCIEGLVKHGFMKKGQKLTCK